MLGHWGEMLVSFADRADLLSTANVHLERRILDYITANVNVTAGGIFSHRMMSHAVDVLGPDRVLFASDDPYGSAGYTVTGSAREFIETAPISAQDKAKFAHLNAERLLGGHTTAPRGADADDQPDVWHGSSGGPKPCG